MIICYYMRHTSLLFGCLIFISKLYYNIFRFKGSDQFAYMNINALTAFKIKGSLI